MRRMVRGPKFHLNIVKSCLWDLQCLLVTLPCSMHVCACCRQQQCVWQHPDICAAGCAGNEFTLPSLMVFTGGNRVLFGSDFPSAPEGTAVYSVSGLDKYFSDDLMTLWKISRGTAMHLIPGMHATSSS